MAHTVTHEHTIKDEVFFMHKNKVTNGKVEAIRIFVNKPNVMSLTDTEIKIQYTIAYKEDGDDKNTMIEKLEKDIFATKQELLNSL